MHTPVALLVLAIAPFASADPRVIFCSADLATGGNSGESWADAFRGPLALQSALAAAHAGDQIWLAQGTYKPALPGGSRTDAFRFRSGVSVLGGFEGVEDAADQRTPGHPTILSGDINGNGGVWPNALGNSVRVAVGVGLDATTFIDSLTFERAIGNIDGIPLTQNGAGLLLLGGSPTVRHCTFRFNYASLTGGGAAAMNCTALFEDCTFDSNTASSGYHLSNSSSATTTVRNCRFIGDCQITGGSVGIGILSGPLSNSPADHPTLIVEDSLFAIDETPFSCPTGMGIYVVKGTATIRRCDFLNNRSCGGGGGVAGEGIVSIDRCRFIGNEGTADGGAAIHSFSGDFTVTNSLFHANDLDGFATIYMGGHLRAVNCTFSHNGSLGGIGGGGTHYLVFSQHAGNSLENCIVWGNRSIEGEAAAVTNTAFGVPPTFDRCLVQAWNGSLPGAGSFAADPRFVDFNGPDNILGTPDDDLHLRADSPAIDRANNNALTSTLDLDDLPRFRDDPNTPDNGLGTAPLADLGAYELQPPCPADFNNDGFVDFFDADAFTACFEGEACPPGQSADFNHDGFTDFFDLDAFIAAFEAGC